MERTKIVIGKFRFSVKTLKKIPSPCRILPFCTGQICFRAVIGFWILNIGTTRMNGFPNPITNNTHQKHLEVTKTMHMMMAEEMMMEQEVSSSFRRPSIPIVHRTTARPVRSMRLAVGLDPANQSRSAIFFPLLFPI